MTVTTRDLHDCAPEPPKAVDVELPQSAVRAGDVFRNVTTTTADDIVSGDKVRIAELERQVEQLRAALDRRMDAARKTACARLPAWWPAVVAGVFKSGRPCIVGGVFAHDLPLGVDTVTHWMPLPEGPTP